MFALTLAFAPYVEAQAMDVAALQGKWVLKGMNGTAVPVENREIFFQIKGEIISGFDGCNPFAGRISDPSSIRGKKRACDPQTVLLPLDLTNPMRQLSDATISGDELFLPMPDGAGEAQFRRSQ